VYSAGSCDAAIQIDQGWNNIAGAAIFAFNGASVMLAASQRTLHLPVEAALFQRAQEAAQRTADAFSSAIDTEVVPITYAPAGIGQGGPFVRLHANEERSRLRDVILASRDGFTRQRTWTVRKLADPSQNRIDRRGGTTLRDLDTWVADDSMVHRWRSGLRRRASLIGQGTAEASDNPASRSEWAANDYNFGASFSGLPAIHDLRDRSTDPTQQRFGVTVRAEKRRSDTLTSQQAAQAGPSGRLAVFDASAAPPTMAALARVEVVFDRPLRADRRVEYANLYSPFWQVRLVTPTAQDRAFAAARQGNVALPAP
jgi:hypothetical protein